MSAYISATRYIQSGGNTGVTICSFDRLTRNTLRRNQLSARRANKVLHDE